LSAGAPTAMVTGATGGLGAAFARQLATRRYGLVLVARTPEHLDKLARDVTRLGADSVQTLTADLTDPADLEKVAARAAEPESPIGLLVNNAGALGRIAPLADQDPAGQDHLVDLDVRSVVRLCRAVLPGMVERRTGRIINVSSVMAFLPAPQGAVYAAAKAFVTSLSESLHCEVDRYGVHVTALCPGSVRSNLHRSSGRGGGRLGPFLDPDAVVRAGLDAVAAGQTLCVPGPAYRRLHLMSRFAPRKTLRRNVLRRFGA
jgi:uncharacterized protein